ncbi:MAG: L-threonylcarbamoyladenylate synthase [Myxococcota bacterium]|nr:L-threonylcarbamoyladenylate synthase [Myxococcota bacterium]
MKTIPLVAFQSSPSNQSAIKETLENGSLICFPAASDYKLGADLSSRRAITAMLQAKRRVNNAPTLVFVPDVSWVDKLVANISDQARRLMTDLWPGPLTLLFQPSDYLEPRVRKTLTKAKGWLGLRMPDDEISRTVLGVFKKPLLVSSANLSKKHGAQSVAQVRKNFGRTVDYLIENGDINGASKSTLVDLTRAVPEVIRRGAISEEAIKRTLAG